MPTEKPNKDNLYWRLKNFGSKNLTIIMIGYAIHKNRDDEKDFRQAFKIEQEKQNEYTYTFCLAK